MAPEQGAKPDVNRSQSLRHPLVVLLVGTLIGSVIVPTVKAHIDWNAKRAELRIEHARAALRASREITKNINARITTFEHYLKNDYGDVDPKRRAANREELKRNIYRLHSAFDEQAWWWHWQLLEDVSVLQLLSADGVKEIHEACLEFQKLMLASSAEMGRMYRLLRPQESAAAVPVAEIKLVVDELRQRSDAAVRNMVAPLIR